MSTIAIIIPCYNEESTIGKVIDECRCALPKATVYVFNNNSTDRTAKIAKEKGALVRNVVQQGKGNVIRQMFRTIDADCYLMIDGDNTYSLDKAMDMCRMILNDEADMVIGDRLSTTYSQENNRPFHNTGNTLVCRLINTFFKSDIKDVMTGMRAMSKRFVKNCPVLSNGFEIETEITINALDKHFRVVSLPIVYRDRPEGSTSKLNTITDGVKVIGTIFELFRTYRPLTFFGWLSLICIIVSAGFFIPVLIDYINTGLVPRFPTLIVCGFLVIIGIMCFFCGIMLDGIMKRHNQNFEIQLMKWKY